MFAFEIDAPRNILILRFKEHFSCEQGKQLCEQLKNQIGQLEKGFRLLTDLSELTDMDFDAHQSIDDLMELCNQNGVAKVIRVITSQSNDIGFNIMSLFHYSHSVIIHTVTSLEDARILLER